MLKGEDKATKLQLELVRCNTPLQQAWYPADDEGLVFEQIRTVAMFSVQYGFSPTNQRVLSALVAAL